MLSDEEKKAIKEIKHFNQLTRYWQEEEYEEKEIAEYITIILNLIEKQSKEIEELKIIADKYEDLKIFYEDNICELEKQSKEIEELKEDNKKKSIVIIEYQDLYEKLEDKIKAMLENEIINISGFECVAKEDVQSLLKE